jgi:hypothetical protein
MVRRSSELFSQLPKSLPHQLSMYALAASATAVSLLALTPATEAEIIYTHAHQVIPTGFPGIYFLNLNPDGVADFEFKNWWNNDPDGSEGFLSVLPARPGNGIGGYGTVGQLAFWGTPFRAGVKLGPHARFYSDTVWMVNNCIGPWYDVKDRYLGLKFSVKGKVHYGWARLTVSCNPATFKNTAFLSGYAYETIPDKAIVTGDTKGPEDVTALPDAAPTGLGALALGRK